MASPFNAEWATRLLESRRIDQVVAAMRAETQARQALVAGLLPRQAILTQPNAYYFCLKLGNGWSAEAYTQAAEEAGVGVTPISLFEVSSLLPKRYRPGLRQRSADRETLREALEKLAGLLEAGAPPTVRFRGAV